MHTYMHCLLYSSDYACLNILCIFLYVFMSICIHNLTNWGSVLHV